MNKTSRFLLVAIAFFLLCTHVARAELVSEVGKFTISESALQFAGADIEGNSFRLHLDFLPKVDGLDLVRKSKQSENSDSGAISFCGIIIADRDTKNNLIIKSYTALLDENCPTTPAKAPVSTVGGSTKSPVVYIVGRDAKSELGILRQTYPALCTFMGHTVVNSESTACEVIFTADGAEKYLCRQNSDGVTNAAPYSCGIDVN